MRSRLRWPVRLALRMSFHPAEHVPGIVQEYNKVLTQVFEIALVDDSWQSGCGMEECQGEEYRGGGDE